MSFKVKMLLRIKMMERKIEGFEAKSRVRIDKLSSVGIYCKLYRESKLYNSTLGNFSYLASKASVANCDAGKFCSIGPEAMIGGLGRHPTNWVSTHPSFYSILGQINTSFSDKNYFNELPRNKIGNDVWIGARAIILDGISIGNGAIIAAGAVVAKDVPPYAIVGGVPAKLIRYRFNNETINELIKLNWWDWPIDTLKKNAHLFRTNTEKAILSLKKS